MKDRGKLGGFLHEVIDWQWDKFCKAEADMNYKGYEGAIFSLIRVCSEGKLGAIKTAISRVDGTVETPIKVEYPKVFILYPEATRVAIGPSTEETPSLALSAPQTTDIIDEPVEPQEEEVHLATMSLRETLKEMAEAPREVTHKILLRKGEVEQALRQGVDLSEQGKQIPLVKSIVAANLLKLAEGGKFEAITEVFDQIDGKLVETIRILGEDMYLNSYVLEAPYGAKKNKDGVYYLEAPQISDTWKAKFNKSSSNT